MPRRAQDRVGRADDRELLASAAHELRTPIAAIRGATAALRRDWDGVQPETRDRLLGVIASAGDQLARLADDLLEAARDTHAGLSVDLRACDVGAVAARAVEAARAAAPGASIELEVAAGAPPALADAGRLEQVIANLVQNALRHGGGAAEVSVAAAPAGVRVEVADRGPGIAEEDRERVFEPFRRLAGATGGGSGLGLYLSRELTRAMGGELSLSSREEGGTVFAVELPRA